MTGTAQPTKQPIGSTAPRRRAARCRECPLGALATQTGGSPISASRQAC